MPNNSIPGKKLLVAQVVSGDLWGGAEAQICALAKSLRFCGDIEVVVIAMNDGELSKRLREAGCRVEIFDESKHSFLSLQCKLIFWVIKERPDVIHTHRRKENILGALAGLLTNTPSIRTVHGAPEHSYRGFRKLVQLMLDAIDATLANRVQRYVVAVSRELSKRLMKKYPQANIVVVRNGFDTDEADSPLTGPSIRGGAEQAIHVGIVGRLVPVKRVDVFINAASCLKKISNNAYIFHIIGDGPLRLELQQLAFRAGVADVCRFHGERRDSVACISELDVLLICSDHEGLPMVVLEAKAVGTKLFAHNVGGMREVLDPEDLVDSQDPEKYAKKILGFSQQRHPRNSNGSLPYEFTARGNAASMTDLYGKSSEP